MRLPGREFLRFLVKFKIEALLLLFLSIATAALSLPLPLTLVLGLLILAVGAYLTYRCQTTEETTRYLRDLGRLADDLDNYCFQVKGEGQDFRIVKLLDKMTFPRLSPSVEAWEEKGGSNIIIGKNEGPPRIEGVRELQLTFQLWLSGLRHKVRVNAKMGRSLSKNDLNATMNEFADFYNNYVERVIERVIWIGNRANIEDKPTARATFNVFRDNLSHLRDRVNTLLKDFRDSGGYVLNEVKAIKTELEA